MKNETIRHIMFWIVVLGISIAMNSCSSRQKEVTKTEESNKAESADSVEEIKKEESNTKVETSVKIDDKTKTVTTKKTAAPIDPSKPASVTDPDGKKTDLHNASLTEETTTEFKDKKIDKAESSQSSSKSEASAKKAAAKKGEAKKEALNSSLDKSGFNFWSYWWLLCLIVIGGVLVYLNNRFKWFTRVTAFFKRK
ncbi:hypothetical protein ACMDB5_13075 [Flavobacterium sp. W1B]|uniref:hypothetical protein n=1 Tax=Flavobacterium sp. W1B TaxID=3394146 RepID=UPI0039BD874B